MRHEQMADLGAHSKNMFMLCLVQHSYTIAHTPVLTVTATATATATVAIVEGVTVTVTPTHPLTHSRQHAQPVTRDAHVHQ